MGGDEGTVFTPGVRGRREGVRVLLYSSLPLGLLATKGQMGLVRWVGESP